MKILLERHSLVAEAQRLLNELGYDAGAVDGKAGPRTAATVTAFQRERGIAQNGTISSELVTLLRRAKENGTTARVAPTPTRQHLPSTLTPTSAQIRAPVQTRRSLHFSSSLSDVKDAIKAGADVNQRSPHNTTPLRRAVLYDKVEVVSEIVKAGADLEARDEWGQTPLHNAVNDRYSSSYSVRLDMVRVLLEAGANPNARDRWGRTPLHYAARECHGIQMLLKAGADANARCNAGKRPIDYVVYKTYLEENADFKVLRAASN
ncbi:MAG: hypothetical protein EOM12_12305 [Verrucomicrobiae bacterium]|nr:hypothetical protein [Verrucomicrobiae bacterium]